MPPLPTTAHRMQSPRGSLEPSSWALSELFRRLRVEAMAVGREGDLMQRLASGQQPPPPGGTEGGRGEMSVGPEKGKGAGGGQVWLCPRCLWRPYSRRNNLGMGWGRS